MPNNFLDQDYGSEEEDDDFNPPTVVESDHENVDDDEAPHDGRRGERTGGDKARSSGDRDKRANVSRDTRHLEDDSANDGEEARDEEDESDGDQEDDDDEEDDDDAVPVRSPLTGSFEHIILISFFP